MSDPPVWVYGQPGGRARSTAPEPAIGEEHLAALRTVIAMWPYAAGKHDGLPLASVRALVKEVLAVLESQC